MAEPTDRDSDRLISRIKEISGIDIKPPVNVLTDTSKYKLIQRGDVVKLDNAEFFVTSDVYEFRFGLEGMPKFWVKRGYDLSSGQRVIIKFEFHEELTVSLGPHTIHCHRSPEKEARVLSLVRGDLRFMQGRSFHDDSGNNVRVMDFISSKSLYDVITEMKMSHEEYYYTRLAPMLEKLIVCYEGIQVLHKNFVVHGDIRSDHILVDEENGEFRWIDFDLDQHSGTYDVLLLGRVLHFTVGKGMNTIHGIKESGRFSPEVLSSLGPADIGWYYPHRIMNLKKLYPYIDSDLNEILVKFSVGAEVNYSMVFKLVQDLKKVIPKIPG
jgi:tRNA A-37 threonylcarbamoyl transferase component Bud32